MKKGFSLVELSIVLVILGLLTGGILAGQSLIRASELRAVATEANRYVAAVQTFRDKYFGIPGDINNATKFWGAADGGDGLGADCTGIVSTTATQLTCNGNNNGSVDGGTNEMNRFWQQLANAGLIEGSYTGALATAADPNHHVFGQNAPRSKMGNGGWSTRALNTGDFTGVFILRNRANNLMFGGQTGSHAIGTILKPEEAWNIDTKMDDGRPGYGSVEASFPAACTTAANNTDSTGNYALNLTAAGCSLLFVNPF